MISQLVQHSRQVVPCRVRWSDCHSCSVRYHRLAHVPNGLLYRPEVEQCGCVPRIQLHGALGYSLDTPLAAWYTHIRSQRLVDGPDEVHKWITGKNVIRAFKKDGTSAAAAGGDLL